MAWNNRSVVLFVLLVMIMWHCWFSPCNTIVGAKLSYRPVFVASGRLRWTSLDAGGLRDHRKLFPMSGCKSELHGPIVQPKRPNTSTYWVTKGLIAGEYPADVRGEEETRRKLRQYLDLGVTFFLDLTEVGEKNGYEAILYDEARERGMEEGTDVVHCRLPIKDFDIPNQEQMKKILNTIDDAMQKHTVYVHCRGGIGRTGTTVGCYLARHGNSGQKALEELNRLFQNSDRRLQSFHSPETTEQISFVRNWKE